MDTLKLQTTARLTDNQVIKTQKSENGFYKKWLTFTESQAKYKTFWFLASMVAQGVFLLPVPVVLIYYFNAPVLILAVTLSLFFANIIAGMGGSSVRVLLSLFALSLLIHLLMLGAFIW